MNIDVCVTDKNWTEVEESYRLLWYPNLVKSIEAYILLFNNLPQIGIEFTDDEYIDGFEIKAISINPISKEILVHFQ